MDEGNPSPFKQPFLVISFKDRKVHKDIADGWHVDVDGQLEKYIEGYEHTIAFAPPANRLDRATPLMRSIVEYFASRGMEIRAIAGYRGSAGPSHILRNGAFFERMKF